MRSFRLPWGPALALTLLATLTPALFARPADAATATLSGRTLTIQFNYRFDDEGAEAVTLSTNGTTISQTGASGSSSFAAANVDSIAVTSTGDYPDQTLTLATSAPAAAFSVPETLSVGTGVRTVVGVDVSANSISFDGPVAIDSGLHRIRIKTGGTGAISFGPSSFLGGTSASSSLIIGPTIAGPTDPLVGAISDVSLAGEVGGVALISGPLQRLASLQVLGNDVSIAGIGSASNPGVDGEMLLRAFDAGADAASLTLTGSRYRTGGQQFLEASQTTHGFEGSRPVSVSGTASLRTAGAEIEIQGKLVLPPDPAVVTIDTATLAPTPTASAKIILNRDVDGGGGLSLRSGESGIELNYLGGGIGTTTRVGSLEIADARSVIQVNAGQIRVGRLDLSGIRDPIDGAPDSGLGQIAGSLDVSDELIAGTGAARLTLLGQTNTIDNPTGPTTVETSGLLRIGDAGTDSTTFARGLVRRGTTEIMGTLASEGDIQSAGTLTLAGTIDTTAASPDGRIATDGPLIAAVATSAMLDAGTGDIVIRGGLGGLGTFATQTAGTLTLGGSIGRPVPAIAATPRTAISGLAGGAIVISPDATLDVDLPAGIAAGTVTRVAQTTGPSPPTGTFANANAFGEVGTAADPYRVEYDGGAGRDIELVALDPAIDPVFSSATATADGFTAQILNIGALTGRTLTASATGSAPASVDGAGLLTVSGLADGETAEATVVTSGPIVATGSSTIVPLDISLAIDITGSGRVASPSGRIDCTASCALSRIEGSTIHLSATPAAGWAFAGWTGACSGKGACAVTMSDQQRVGAVFTESTSVGAGATGASSANGRIRAGRAAGSYTIPGTRITLRWPALAFRTDVEIEFAPARARRSAVAGGGPVVLAVTDAAGRPLTRFAKPLEIRFGGVRSGRPARSVTGARWTTLPMLARASASARPGSGWKRVRGAVAITTRTPARFAVLAASRPRLAAPPPAGGIGFRRP